MRTRGERFSADTDDAVRLRLVLDTVQDAFVEIDAAGAITDWNPAAEVLFGWRRSEVLGRALVETIIPPLLREPHLRALQRFMQGGTSRYTGRRLELPALARSGREFRVELSVAPIRVGDDWRFAAFMRDVTERAAARAELERRHGRLAQAQRVARLGSWDWDAETGAIAWSAELCRICGVEPCDLAVDAARALVHPDDRELLDAALRTALRGGEQVEFDCRIVRPDGTVITLHVHGAVLRDATGRVDRMTGTAQDVTARVSAEARSRRLAALVDSTDDAVISEDREGLITSWNEGAERLYGWSEHEALGQPSGIVVPRGRGGEEALIRGRVLGGERVRHYETQRVTKDGRMIDVSLTVSPVRDATGRILEASSIARDITQRRRAERELERYVADLESLALRDPLTGLLTRRELQGLLDRELGRAARENGEVSLLLVDVDGLAAVNAAHGREGGDRLLRDLAETVVQLTPDLTPCRMADDEIAIVLPGSAAGAAMALGHRIKEAWAERRPLASVSVGVATWPGEAADKDLLFERACEALGFDKPGGTLAAPRETDPLALSGREGDTVERVLALVRRHLGMEVAYLSEFTGDRQVVKLVDAAGEHPDIAPGRTVPLADSYCRRMVDDELPNVVADTAAHPATAALAVTQDAGIGSYVGVPVRLADGTLYGSLCCASRAPREDLGEQAAHFARVCARLVADLVEQRELEDHNRRLQSELTGVRALLAALDARDHYTGAHSEAVVALAVGVARRLDLGKDETAAVEQVALLHDIGKIGVPDEILQKPGALDDAEWVVMKEHTAIGERIVRSITSLSHLAAAIRAEHERWDGRGYPDGIAGDAIPLASRIILACDALHAMTSDRPYRKSMPLAAAIAELRRGAGTQFDPRVVDALITELTPEVDGPRAPSEQGAAPVRPSVLVVEDNATFRLALEAGLESEGFAVEAVPDAAAAYRRARELAPDLVLLDWILPGGEGGAQACRKLRQAVPESEVVIFTGLGDVRDRRAALEAGASMFLQKGMPLPALVEHLRVALASAR